MKLRRYEESNKSSWIPLLDTTYKVLSIAILWRLEMYSVDIVGEYQCSFKKKKVHDKPYSHAKTAYR